MSLAFVFMRLSLKFHRLGNQLSERVHSFMSSGIVTFINWYLYRVLLIPKELYVLPSASDLKNLGKLEMI